MQDDGSYPRAPTAMPGGSDGFLQDDCPAKRYSAQWR